MPEKVDEQFNKNQTTKILARVIISLAIIVGHFIIFNLFIAINVAQVDEANKDYQEELVSEREALLSAKKAKILQRRRFL